MDDDGGGLRTAGTGQHAMPSPAQLDLRERAAVPHDLPESEGSPPESPQSPASLPARAIGSRRAREEALSRKSDSATFSARDYKARLWSAQEYVAPQAAGPKERPTISGARGDHDERAPGRGGGGSAGFAWAEQEHVVDAWAHEPVSPGLGEGAQAANAATTAVANISAKSTHATAAAAPSVKARPASARARFSSATHRPSSAAKHSPQTTARPASGGQRATVVSPDASSAQKRRPASAITRQHTAPATRQRANPAEFSFVPGSAKNYTATSEDEELLSSANIMASRLYAGLDESKALEKIKAGDAIRDRDHDVLDQTSASHATPPQVPPYSTPRRHLRSLQDFERMDSPAEFAVFKVPGFSHRLAHTEVPRTKSLLQQVQERGGGSTLSFESNKSPNVMLKDAFQRKMPEDKVINLSGVNERKALSRKGHSTAPPRERGRRNEDLPTPVKDVIKVEAKRGRGGDVAGKAMSSLYPYYQNVNKGKERDGEHVGLTVLPMRMPKGAESPGGGDYSVRSKMRNPNILGNSVLLRKAGSSSKSVHIQRRPLSAQLREDIPSPTPADARKKGAITIAELDRQLRLLEIQAKAEERRGGGGWAPLSFGESQTDESDALWRNGRRTKGFLLPYGSRPQSALSSPHGGRGRGGAETPRSARSVRIQASWVPSGAGSAAAVGADLVPFEVWSFQGPGTGYRRPEVPELSFSLENLDGDAGKENAILQARNTPRFHSLKQAPAHYVLKGQGGAASMTNGRFADQSMRVRGRSLFHVEEETGDFLNMAEIMMAYKDTAEENVGKKLQEAVEQGDQLGQRLRNRMKESSLVQQMEQHCHNMRDFLRSVLDHMETPGYEGATQFVSAWQDKRHGQTDFGEEIFSRMRNQEDAGEMPKDVRMDICEDVWKAVTEKNAYVKAGVLDAFIPDLMPESLKYDGAQAVVSLLQRVLDRDVSRWWDADPVVQQFQSDFLEAVEEKMPQMQHNPEIAFDLSCRMKESILVRAMVIPSYLIAVMTSGLWDLPPLYVTTADESRMWLQTGLLLKMFFLKQEIDSRTDHRDHEWPTIRDSFWSTKDSVPGSTQDLVHCRLGRVDSEIEESDDGDEDVGGGGKRVGWQTDDGMEERPQMFDDRSPYDSDEVSELQATFATDRIS